jgi:hypothetical protein
MSISLLPNQRIRKVLIALATVTVMGIAPTHAVASSSADSGSPSTGGQADEYGWTVTRSPVGELSLSPSVPLTTKEAKAAAIGFESSLSPGTIYFTGDYKTVAVSGPHVTEVPVYKRSYKACFAGNSAWKQCTTGVIVFAKGYATCGSSCTIASNLGSHACGTGDSGAIGYNVELRGCGEARFKCGLALSLWESDDVSVSVPLAGHRTFDWHINAYSTGTMTGPWNGRGADPAC